MARLETMIKYRRLVFSLVAILVLVGVISFGSMARQEDPSFPYRAGTIKVLYPGGSPSQIEALITVPLEEELAQIAEINTINSNSRDDIAIVNIELKDGVYDTDAAWSRVERAIERARVQFPEGVREIDFDDRLIDLPVAVISIIGSTDRIQLANAARKLKQQLLLLPGVSRIEIEGEPEEEVVVQLDDGALEQLNLSRSAIASAIRDQNQIVSGGVLSSNGRAIRINPQSDLASIREIADTPIRTSNGTLIPLSSFARVSLEPRTPLASLRFDNGDEAVSLGVIVTRGQTDVVKFGEQLRTELTRLSDEFAPLEIRESFFQPDYVSQRLSSLQGSLLLSILIIALVVFLALGWRTGVLVAAVLPTVSLITLGLYNAGGGVFHQIAVIGIVISLGILIDNAIVVIEFLETRLREGATRAVAMRDAMSAMAKPLLASTGTTIAAFIPLLLAKGGVGDFTRAIPVMIVTALIVSYVISVFVWPLLGFYWLKDRNKETTASANLVLDLTQRIASWCGDAVSRGPIKVLLVTLVSVLLSLSLAPTLKQQFFPSTDRNQFVVDIEMPVGTPVQQTEQVSREIQDKLQARPEVSRTYRAVGATGFRFYYNLSGQPDESHVARITVNTLSGDLNRKVVQWVRNELERDYPNATLVARILGQGPPRPAPIELRISHHDPAQMFSATQHVRRLLSEISGVADLRTDLDLGSPEIALDVQRARALTSGLSTPFVAAELYGQTRGVLAGQFRYADDPVPIRVRSRAGDATNISQIENQIIRGIDGGVSLGQVARQELRWAPTNIRHYAGVRTATVLAEMEHGAAFNIILRELKAALEQQPLPPDVKLEFGGDASASAEANSNIATAAPLALAMLVFFMMYQFNSFRRIGIVFFTIPLAAVGVIPGLVLSGQPFGFQSLLGVIALVGIVVNNAIVLIDVIDQRLAAHDTIENAVRTALAQRTAPILLTTATTILGLLPLAFSSSTLWPPMAWAIISGLALSTILTLIAIPALCLLFLGKYQDHTPRIEQLATAPGLAALLLAATLVASVMPYEEVKAESLENSRQHQQNLDPQFHKPLNTEASSQPLELEEVIVAAKENHLASSAKFSSKASKFRLQQARRAAWAPTVSVGGQWSQRDESSNIALPTGNLTVADQDSHVAELVVSQPLFQPAKQRFGVRAAEFDLQSALYQQQRAIDAEVVRTVQLFTSVLRYQSELAANDALDAALSARMLRVERQLEVGNALKSDWLQVSFELNRLRLQRNNLEVAHEASRRLLSNALQLELGDLPLSLSEDVVESLAWSEIEEGAIVCDLRADCLAISSQIRALSQRIKALSAASLPSVNIAYRDTRAEGQLFVPEKDQRVMLEFGWSLFSGGVRKSEQSALRSQRQALQARWYALNDTVSNEWLQAQAARDVALEALKLSNENQALSQERLRLMRARYEAGLVTIDALLEAEAASVKANHDVAIARYNIVDAWAVMRLSVGESF